MITETSLINSGKIYFNEIMLFVLEKTVGSLLAVSYNANMWPCSACMRAHARQCMFVCLSVCVCVCMCDTQNSMITDTSYFGEKTR